MEKEKINLLVLLILCLLVILGTFVSNTTSFLLNESCGRVTLVKIVVIEILALFGLLIIGAVSMPFLGPLIVPDTPRSPIEKVIIGIVIMSVLVIFEGLDIARKKPDGMSTIKFVVNNNFILDSSSTDWDILPGPKLKVGSTEYKPAIDVPIPNIIWKAAGRTLYITFFIISLYFSCSGTLSIIRRRSIYR